MKTMKIIDILVNIANGKKVPKKIKYQGSIFTYNEEEKDYETWFENKSCLSLFNLVYITPFLNDEIEIIEETPKEDKKIEKPILDTDNDVNGSYDIVIINDIKYEINKVNRYILGKICEIIDKIDGE